MKDMSFEKIISIPGQSGLYKMVAQMRNGGFVVESLSDGRRMPVSSVQRIVMLKDIAVFTTGDDVPLYQVFKKMKEDDAFSSSVSPKAEPAELKSSLKKLMPEFDEERVHVSDIRKMFSWYRLVREIVGSPESEKAMSENQEEVGVEDTSVEANTVEEVPAAKPATKTRKAATAATEAASSSEEVTAQKKKKRKAASTEE
jgi:hypothetical protein